MILRKADHFLRDAELQYQWYAEAVGGVLVAAFQALVESIPGAQQEVENAEAALRDARGDLRAAATQLDQENKRWYAAWQGEFPPGTPENDALGQITTEPGGSDAPPEAPGVATIASVQVTAGTATVLGLASAGATSFKVQRKSQAAAGFDDVADEVPGPDYSFGQLPAGSYEVRAAGRNALGLGPWSAATPFTVV